jgi:hypothetical protein
MAAAQASMFVLKPKKRYAAFPTRMQTSKGWGGAFLIPSPSNGMIAPLTNAQVKVKF